MTAAILASALAMALVHLLSPWLSFLPARPRSGWLSVAGGVSTAYVFVHLLPELAHHQAQSFQGAGAEIFLIALAGMVVFYGLERWAKLQAGAEDSGAEMPAGAFWLHLGQLRRLQPPDRLPPARAAGR